MTYKNFILLAGYKNKPNSNPIKPNFKKAKMNVNSLITKDYRKKEDFSVRINKPNLVRCRRIAKMNVNAFLQKDYENEPPSGPKKTNPIQTQFLQRPCCTIDGFENFSYCTEQT